MPASPMSAIVQRLRSAALLQEGAERTDAELLESFVSGRDAAALELLVRRHGPMVWGVCRRILRDPEDAEDAFQASFLVLVRRAAAIVPREMVGNWLYGVAQRTALKARASRATRRARERQVETPVEPAVPPQEPGHDLHAILDQELSRLPAKYRVAIVLCDLEGMARKEAARHLGLPDGTLATRLARGRALLAKRLARHGLPALGGGALLAVGSGCVSASLVTSTIKLATGQAAAGLISARAAALTEGVLQAMWWTKFKTTAGMLVLVVLVLFLAGLHLLSPPVQAGADDPAAPVFSGKPALIQAKDAQAVTMEKVTVRQLGGRAFLVGREMKDDPYKLTRPHFGGATVWVPLDAITSVVELEPPKREK